MVKATERRGDWARDTELVQVTAGSLMLSFSIKMHIRKSWLLGEGGIESKNFNLI